MKTENFDLFVKLIQIRLATFTTGFTKFAYFTGNSSSSSPTTQQC